MKSMNIIDDFFYKYYIEPIKEGSGYNPVNTITYGLILCAAIYIIYLLFKKLEININRGFYLALIPFIFLGSSTSALKDLAKKSNSEELSFYDSYLFVTPPIYLIFGGLFFLVFLITFSIEKKIKLSYEYILGLCGLLLCIPNIYLIIKHIERIEAIFLIFSFFIISSFIFYLFAYYFMKSTFSSKNLYIIFAHLFDATTTFVGIQYYGYWEQHVVPQLLIDIFNTAAIMYFLKVIVLVPLIIYLDKELKEDKNFLNLLKLSIFVLGLAPGIRNALRIFLKG